MTEFSTLVGVTLVGDTTQSFQFLADEFTFEPSPTDDNGGVIWDCSKTFVVDMPASEALQQLKIPRKAIVTLSKLTRMRPECDPNVIRIGTQTIPARSIFPLISTRRSSLSAARCYAIRLHSTHGRRCVCSLLYTYIYYVTLRKSLA